jgi:glycine cleavage system H protein
MLEYTETHEWIQHKGSIATVGLTEKAQKELGEIVYIELPKVGDMIQKDDTICVLESTKAAIDLYSPIAGKVVQINVFLQKNPEKINELCESEKWLYKLEVLPS